MTPDAWAVWLVLKREERVDTIERLAQSSGIARRKDGRASATTAHQRAAVGAALAELEDLGLVERQSGRYLLHPEREAEALLA